MRIKVSKSLEEAKMWVGVQGPPIWETWNAYINVSPR